MKELRNYQSQLVNKGYRSFAQGKQAIAIQLQTGGGKTRVAAKIAYDARTIAQQQVLFIAHRRELVLQAYDEFTEWGLSPGLIMSGFDESPLLPVQCASIQTMENRSLPDADLVIADEIHTLIAWQEIMQHYKKRSRMIGLTATPGRNDGTGLRHVFEDLIMGPSVGWLIRNQYLAPYQVYRGQKRADTSKIEVISGDYLPGQLSKLSRKDPLLGDLVRAYKRYCFGKSCLTFGCDKAHSKAIAARYNRAGIPALHVDSDNTRKEREDAIAAFRSGEIWVLSNVELFTTGTDFPWLAALQLARPTVSLPLARQMIGRVMRMHEGKPYGIIMDHAGVIDLHGYPDEQIDWLPYFNGLPPEEFKRLVTESRKQKERQRRVVLADHGADLVEDAWGMDLTDIPWWETEEGVIEYPLLPNGQYELPLLVA